MREQRTRIVIRAGHIRVADLRERAANVPFRAAGVAGDVGELCSLQTELEDPAGARIELAENPLELIGQRESVFGGWVLSRQRSAPAST